MFRPKNRPSDEKPPANFWQRLFAFYAAFIRPGKGHPHLTFY
jgi:hypothetical protein